jgi:F-type H+-transporting ATPase subunit delta
MDNVLVPYARAIYSVAHEQNKVQEWIDLLQDISGELNKSSLQDFMQNPSVSTNRKAKIISESLIKANYPEEIVRFLEYLTLNSKILMLNDVVEIVKKQNDDNLGIKRVTVVQAMETSQDYKQKIQAWLSDNLGGDVVPSWQIDSDLIGGFVVEIGNTVYDYSIKAKINQIKESLM